MQTSLSLQPSYTGEIKIPAVSPSRPYPRAEGYRRRRRCSKMKSVGLGIGTRGQPRSPQEDILEFSPLTWRPGASAAARGQALSARGPTPGHHRPANQFAFTPWGLDQRSWPAEVDARQVT